MATGIEEKPWMVDCQGPPVDSPDSRPALVYVAGYVSGVAFSDRRILSDNGQEIELYMWDYRTNSEATIRLTPDEFIRRFSSHILPSSVSRVRHSGMYHGKLKAKKLALCRELLAQGNQGLLFLEYSLRGPSTAPATADHPAAELAGGPASHTMDADHPAAELAGGPASHTMDADHPAEYSLLAALGLDAADIAGGAFDSADLRHIADSRDIQPTDDELQEVRTYYRDLAHRAREEEAWQLRLAEARAESSEHRMTTAISDALNLNHSLEQAQGRIDAELHGRGDTYLAPPEKPTPACRRCGLPSMRRLGLFFGYAAALLLSEWSYRSKKIRSATGSWLITTAATMITTFDTLRSESTPRTSSRSVINSWLTPQSLDVIAAPPSLTATNVRRACLILTTFDVIPSHLPRPDT